MIVPRLDEIDGKRNLVLRGERRAVEPDAGARFLRGKADYDGALDAVCRHGANGIGDVGPPIAHANINWQVEFTGEQSPLFHSQLGEGRMADQAVAVLYFLD